MIQLRTLTRYARTMQDIDSVSQILAQEVRNIPDSNPWTVKGFQVVPAHEGGYLVVATLKR